LSKIEGKTIFSRRIQADRNPGLLRTRNSAIADKPRDAFRGQSRSSNNGTILYVTYGFLSLCYSNFVRKTHRFF